MNLIDNNNEKHVSAKEKPAKNYKKDLTRNAFFVTPLLLQVATIFTLFSLIEIKWAFLLFFIPILGFVIYLWHDKISTYELPETGWDLIKPALSALFYYLLIWVLCYWWAGYQQSKMGLTIVLAFPFSLMLLVMWLNASMQWFPLIIISTYTFMILFLLWDSRKKKIPFQPPKKALVTMVSFVCVVAIILHQLQVGARATRENLYMDSQVEYVYDGLYYYHYYFPFREESLLATYDGTPSIAFTEDYPRLDGTGETLPIYAAVVQATYKNVTASREYVQCSNNDGIHWLLEGQTDIFFSVRLSQKQINMAEQSGVELHFIPIAYEPFVFFVHNENPVSNLTIQQIQSIYLEEITNWEDVGGIDERIFPFQRRERSASHSFMCTQVMQGETLPPPLMGEINHEGFDYTIATYRNYSSSIGYTFHYFATQMPPKANIKLLSVDGVAPTAENVQNGTYPFVVTVYAITTGDESENTQILIDWLLSEEGQAFIEKCGYIPLS